MAVSKGTRLGPYEIRERVGAGGMGEVYRAHDTRLGREVAIKISADRFTDRFEREARIIASLNHPHICTLHDIGPNYLVMEYIEGLTLAQRISAGALPLEETLPIARQIAEALHCAHEKGIIHRDLKPANIKLTTDGNVKVLDFGLAAMRQQSIETDGETESSPTLTLTGTAAGVILGTAGYMSPEQARGIAADKRADIWAYGIILYEMLTGRQVFPAKTIPEAVAAILKDEPDWNALPSRTPASIRRLLRRCLERDRQNRLHDIGDARLEIEDALTDREDKEPLPHPAPTQSSRRIWIGLSIVSVAAALVLAAMLVRRQDPPAMAAQVSILPPEDAINVDRVSVSPDGRMLAFVALDRTSPPKLYVRPLENPTARLLNGTDGAGTPFWSPDGRYLAYTTNLTNKLMKVRTTGGRPQVLCDSDSTATGTWGVDGTILIGRLGDGLFRVSASDGSIRRLTTPDASRKERRHTSPQFIPGTRQFLYVAASDEPGKSMLYAASLDSAQRTPIMPVESTVSFVPLRNETSRGYLLFSRADALLAQPFDTRRFGTTGEPFVVAETIGSASFTGSAIRYAHFSAGGPTLAYWQDTVQRSQLFWFNRSGQRLGAVGKTSMMASFTLSPDRNHVAAIVGDFPQRNADLWLIDCQRGTQSRLTFERGLNGSPPLFSFDGQKIAFSSSRGDVNSIRQKSASGTGAEDELLESRERLGLFDWSADGRFIAYSPFTSQSERNIWILPLAGDRKPFRFPNPPGWVSAARFSPDSKWIVYASDEGRAAGGRSYQIYVQPFSPESTNSRKWQISVNGGFAPCWRNDGKELFYREGRRVLAVEIRTKGENFEAGIPQPLFDAPAATRGNSWLATDGERFLLPTAVENEAALPVTLLLNWTAGIHK